MGDIVRDYVGLMAGLLCLTGARLLWILGDVAREHGHDLARALWTLLIDGAHVARAGSDKLCHPDPDPDDRWRCQP